ncbi:UDP-N-acetylglucosamine--N-acetylmuramyl-(pentapeptide) pyrophosphoryl-undecaprenol N-acetylglucosamine transferase [Chlamydiifrater volucris]|uniref:UDP-N-acetylglucosamine--N-acetylmuramyl- (pentapeptide) pyrophosphoryl-undecaprenol N-acetylglucosamine transferase n=1 Tax=Chlamydiifrater volucris TaxID=2681470 RepID=UPI001BCE6640|nr:UDP-N-acetylglucosamine--N-acetylmuramyl-(pentapeptide) pyrophosphoryl-undecaprenol N-acetylglucosamine transferase [Chlamydiifrater volucris]
MKIRKVILATGGTGGHVIPALEAARLLSQQGIEVLLLGNNVCKHICQKGDGFAIQEVPSAPVIVHSPFEFFRNLRVLSKGVFKAKSRIKAFKPDYMIGFGSYHSLPVLLAAIWSRIPFILHEQNIVPGKVNRVLTPFSRGVCGTFMNPSTVTCKQEDLCNKQAEEKFLKIFSGVRPIIVVVGGSQGAKTLNVTFPKALRNIHKKYPAMGVFHIVGSQCSKEDLMKEYQNMKVRHIVTNFENQLPSLMHVADLVIARAGAKTMEELIRVQTPAILIPYPGAYNHQRKNAEFFVENIRGGEFLEESLLTPQALAESIEYSLSPQVMEKRKMSLEQYWKERKPRTIVQFLQEL